MKILKVTGFKGTEFERRAKTLKVLKIESEFNNWIKIIYRVPRGRKNYAMFLRAGDIER